ncbi:uncharacterized protein LOC108868174 isoform X2 [Pyrus x bretschneideri]|uniref:uncharacterized protein LOC108868174 isoform X2 n=1 Tax=Pyrus x bretschneideri TaxID=225117 RepID=UPI00202DBA77|nr:uncharacterized protein LOC108868174 isoform X2 [Pyrus x bretschneideri]
MRALIHPIRDFGRIIGNYGPQSEILKRNRKFRVALALRFGIGCVGIIFEESLAMNKSGVGLLMVVYICLWCRVDELKILTEEFLVDMAIKEAFKRQW